MKPADEPMLDPQGDVGMSRHLSKALKILADSPIDPDLRKQLREILRGEGSLRDLAASEPFQRLSDSIVPKALMEFADQSPEERQRLAEQGNAILERYRHEGPEAPITSDQPREPERRESPTAASSDPIPEQASHTSSQSAQHVVPGTRKPNRDRIVTPEDPDDDDLYYQDRRQRGWLE
ncbi:hypothetical protein ACFYT3_07205 [Nocardia amikacinitolerans]|uniref:hypothetical protein n=1 Tax=Nocardia amikacinitolerans TaxID=756689 RepID=UPI0036C3D0ED